MRRHAVVFAAFILIAGSDASACTARGWDPFELIENKTVCSENGRFCVVVRWYPTIADFASERAGKVLGMDDPEPIDENAAPSPEPKKTVTAALYDTRVLVREIELDVEYARDVSVSSSGRYLVAFRPLGRGGCGGWAADDDPLLAIYDSRGSRVAALKAGDLLSSYDVRQIARSDDFVRLELRHESESREVAVLRIPAPSAGGEPRFEERRVELATGALLDARRDVYPVPRAYAEPAGELFARAIYAPLPELPILAYKANIRGAVRVELLVSEDGEVLDVRATKTLPFGMDAAAVAAARQWRFKPAIVDGRPVRTRGEILFRFKE